MIFRTVTLVAACIAATVVSAAAQAYPTKPIRMVVISPPGGTTDILSRALAQQMAEGFAQTVVTDNRPGGGGILASEIVARSNPDGHTLLYTHTSHSVLPSLHKKLPYDTLQDFQPVALVALFPGVLIVHPGLPVKTTKELIAMAKARPGKLNYAAGTTGATAHLSGELFKTMAGVDIVHIPYKGTAAQITSVIAGESQFTFASLPAVLPHVQSGRVRAIAVGSAKRSPTLPDVPTVTETALPGFDVSAWNGILAPRGTPRAIVDRLNAEVGRIAKLADVKERAASQGAELATETPEYFGNYVKAQVEKWGRVVRSSGMKAD